MSFCKFLVVIFLGFGSFNIAKASFVELCDNALTNLSIEQINSHALHFKGNLRESLGWLEKIGNASNDSDPDIALLITIDAGPPLKNNNLAQLNSTILKWAHGLEVKVATHSELKAEKNLITDYGERQTLNLAIVGNPANLYLMAEKLGDLRPHYAVFVSTIDSKTNGLDQNLINTLYQCAGCELNSEELEKLVLQEFHNKNVGAAAVFYSLEDYLPVIPEDGDILSVDLFFLDLAENISRMTEYSDKQYKRIKERLEEIGLINLDNNFRNKLKKKDPTYTRLFIEGLKIALKTYNANMDYKKRPEFKIEASKIHLREQFLDLLCSVRLIKK